MTELEINKILFGDCLTGMNFIAFELEERYCNEANARLKTELGLFP